MNKEVRRREYLLRILENLLLDIDRDDLSTAQLALTARREIDGFFQRFGAGVWASVIVGFTPGESSDDE